MNATYIPYQYTIYDLSDHSLVECEPCGHHDTAESISLAYAATLAERESWRVEVLDSAGHMADWCEGEYVPEPE